MRPPTALRFIPLVALVASCGSTGSASTPGTSPAATSKPAATASAAEKRERTGTIVPATSEAVSIWPEAYSGELLVTEVLSHGAPVKKGQVIAKLELRSIDDQIRQADLEADSAAVRHEGVVARNAIDDDAARAAREQAQASLDRARRSLEGWMKSELPFARRSDALGKRNEDAGIDDQKDELTQLEKMYSADELVDATEEIVLKRSKRRLAISEDYQGLSSDRRQYRIDLEEALQTEMKQEAVQNQELALDRLVRSQEIEQRSRADALARSADTLKQQRDRLAKLKRDKKRLAIRAPRGGVLLHGKEKDYRAGRAPARYERGSQLAFRTDLFLVADPDSFAVALEVPESMLGTVHEGMQAEIHPLVASGKSAKGTVHLDAYPASKAGGDEAVCEARIDVEGPLEGVRFGMRAKVVFAEAPASNTTAASP
jgi:multidrug resistance efflux pump